MSVDLEPAELDFKRPFTNEVAQTLHLRNPHNDPVAFKVKTTAPKRYCVRPNSGRIEPGKQVEVQVLLQAMKEEPPEDVKCRDKFLVQSVAVTADKEFSNVTSIWQDVEKTAKSSIQERKIRVNFVSADSSEEPREAETNGINIPEENPPAYTSPAVAKFDTPSGQPRVSHISSETEVLQDTPEPPRSYQQSSNRSPAELPSDNAKLDGPFDTLPSPESREELASKLNESRVVIKQLQEQLAELESWRKASLERSSTKEGPANLQQQRQQQQQHQRQQPAEAGVPLQVVAALCLLSFLLAYFFF